MSGISCSATITGIYSIPAGPLASHPPASYMASCDFTQRLLHSGVTRFQNWFRFQKVFQKASQPKAGEEGSSSCLTCSPESTHFPSTSLKILRLQRARYMLV